MEAGRAHPGGNARGNYFGTTTWVDTKRVRKDRQREREKNKKRERRTGGAGSLDSPICLVVFVSPSFPGSVTYSASNFFFPRMSKQITRPALVAVREKTREKKTKEREKKEREKKEKTRKEKGREAREGKNELASKLPFTQTGGGGEPSE